jgi:hypothetical protein
VLEDHLALNHLRPSATCQSAARNNTNMKLENGSTDSGKSRPRELGYKVESMIVMSTRAT